MGEEMSDGKNGFGVPGHDLPVGRITFGLWEADLKEYVKFIKGDEPPQTENFKTAVLRCPKCTRRHGDKVADTRYIGWRCRKCKSDIKGKVEDGEFIEV